MNDLGTRLRSGLGSNPVWRSPDDLLARVRRGARRRRARRTTVVAAAAVLALAAVGGGVGWHRHQLQATDTNRGSLPRGAIGVSVTGAGDVFKVSSNQGCASPCSSIWEQEGRAWTKLASITSSDQSTLDAVIRQIVMAPNGRDGWAWGRDLYATHDGGATWTRITSGPAAGSAGVEDLQVGQTQVWLTTSQTGGSHLWRSSVGSDTWTEVPPPRVSGPWGKDVPARHWFVLDVLPDGRVALDLTHVYIGNEYGWTRYPRPACRHTGPLLGGKMRSQTICGPVGRELNWGSYPWGGSHFQVGLHRASASDPVGQPDILFVRGDRATIDTPSGTVSTDLQLGTDDEVVDWQQAGAHVAILTRGHRVFLSHDSGRHWAQVR